MKARVVCSIIFHSDNPALYEMRWKKICGLGQVTDDKNLTIRCIRIAWWITRFTNTQSGYIIPIFFSPTETVVTRKGLNVTLCLHFMSLRLTMYVSSFSRCKQTKCNFQHVNLNVLPHSATCFGSHEPSSRNSS
jgi:hypothetical protein